MHLPPKNIGIEDPDDPIKDLQHLNKYQKMSSDSTYLTMYSIIGY